MAQRSSETPRDSLNKALGQESPTSVTEAPRFPPKDAETKAKSRTPEDEATIHYHHETLPFFIIPMLHDVIESDVRRAQLMLAPKKKCSSTGQLADSEDEGEVSSISKKLFSSAPNLHQQQHHHLKSLQVANGYNSQGLAHAQRLEWKSAAEAWQYALEIRLQVCGLHSLETSNIYNNMGIVYGKLGRVNEAVKALQQALYIRRRHFTAHHPQMVAVVHNLANVYSENGDTGQAKQFLTKCKDLEPSLHVARAVVALGDLCAGQEDYLEAQNEYIHALRIYQDLGYCRGHAVVEDVLRQLEHIEARTDN